MYVIGSTTLQKLVPLLAALSTVACGDDPRGNMMPKPGSDAAGELGDGALAHPLHIRWDYAYDARGFFAEETRRALLQEAARIWGALLPDDFPSVPQGTEVLVRDPQAPGEPGLVFPIDEAIDDVAVFVGAAQFDGSGGQLAGSRPSAALASVTDRHLADDLALRFHGPQFEPWTGWLSFDQSDKWFFDGTPATGDDLPGDSYDFLTVALHELGHVLGVGTSDAFQALIDGDGFFVGSRATQVYGGPVPLSADRMHIRQGVSIGGFAPLMDERDRPGVRSLPTALDAAILEDIGYSAKEE